MKTLHLHDITLGSISIAGALIAELKAANQRGSGRHLGSRTCITYRKPTAFGAKIMYYHVKETPEEIKALLDKYMTTEYCY